MYDIGTLASFTSVYLRRSVQGGQWGSEDYRLPFFFTILSTNYQLFDTLSTNFIDFSIFRIFGPDIDPEPELNFHLKKLANF